jgi:hypothetical protein
MDDHFLIPERLMRLTEKKMDKDVVKNIQTFTDKILNDILNRAALLSRHIESDTVGAEEISIVIEKNFDYSFGQRILFPSSHLPTDKHTGSMAEISKASD